MRSWFLSLLLLPTAALASGGWDFTGTYISPGLNLGYGFDDHTEVNFGGEISLVRLTVESTWYGLYVDGLHAFGGDTTRLSAGFEGGYLLGGMDAGVIYDTATESYGTRARFILSLVFPSAYVATTWLPDQGAHWEVGLLVKVPIPIVHE